MMLATRMASQLYNSNLQPVVVVKTCTQALIARHRKLERVSEVAGDSLLDTLVDPQRFAPDHEGAGRNDNREGDEGKAEASEKSTHGRKGRACREGSDYGTLSWGASMSARALSAAR